MELVKIGKVKPNKDNPRFIKEDKFKKLVKSIKEFPEMLKLRPIVVNKDMIVLGGNMRLKACAEAGLKEVYILKAEGLTEEQEREFIVKDNVGFGEWDWDILGNEWDALQLQEWGLEGFPFEEVELDAVEGEEEEENETHKTISIAFPLKNYEEANTLINYWKEQGMCVGTILHKLLKTYPPK